MYLMIVLPYSWFFEVLKFCECKFFSFHEWSSTRYPLIFIFKDLNFTNLSISVKFKYLEKTNYTVCIYMYFRVFPEYFIMMLYVHVAVLNLIIMETVYI